MCGKWNWVRRDLKMRARKGLIAEGGVITDEAMSS